MDYNQYILSNGLRIVHKPTYSQVAYCGFAIDAGTRDELDSEQGMAHFVEHLIFKGTKKRKAWHILNRMENVGGDLNAFTNKEETIVYSAFLKEHFSRALELLKDIVFDSVFPNREIEKEVKVILDEIESYKDNPSELIFDEFDELIFPNHPLGRNILGNTQQLLGFDHSKALSFTQKFYQPSNMVFFVSGDLDFKKIVKQCDKLLSPILNVKVAHQRFTLPEYIPTHQSFKKDTHQGHVMIGARGYEAHDDRRTGLYLLNNILGGPGMNSKLNISLREKRGYVYNVESNISSYTDTGVFSIYFGTDLKKIEKCTELVYKELKKLRDKRLTTTQLTAAKKQLIGEIGVASDNNENNILSLAKTFLHYNRCESHNSLFKRIENLSSSFLLEIANEKFDEDYLSTLIYR